MAKTELEKQKEKQAEEELYRRANKIAEESTGVQLVFGIIIVFVLFIVAIFLTGNGDQLREFLLNN